MIRTRLLQIVIFSCLFFSTSQAQTVSTGHEQAKAIVNFTDLAQYELQHPVPIPAMPIEIENEEDDSKPEHDVMPPANEIHYRQNQAMNINTPVLPLLPISPNPTDTFQAKGDNNSYIPPDTHGAVDSNYCVYNRETVMWLFKRVLGVPYRRCR